MVTNPQVFCPHLLTFSNKIEIMLGDKLTVFARKKINLSNFCFWIQTSSTIVF